jgi:hypothetical protein
MMVSVYVGFLYMEIWIWLFCLVIVMSRKLILLSCSISLVNSMLGCKELKLFVMVLMSVWRVPYMIRMSSTYRK